MTLFFYTIIGGITFVAFLHAWARKEFDISRTIVINRPKAEVYAFIRQLKKQPLWMPWYRIDPQLQLKFRGEDGKPGSATYWKGNQKLREGMQKITKIREGKVMETQVFVIQPYKTFFLMYMGVKELESERTKIVWGIRGSHKFPASVFMIFYGMQKKLGGDFEEGLQSLKRLLEKE